MTNGDPCNSHDRFVAIDTFAAAAPRAASRGPYRSAQRGRIAAHRGKPVQAQPARKRAPHDPARRAHCSQVPQSRRRSARVPRALRYAPSDNLGAGPGARCELIQCLGIDLGARGDLRCASSGTRELSVTHDTCSMLFSLMRCGRFDSYHPKGSKPLHSGAEVIIKRCPDRR